MWLDPFFSNHWLQDLVATLLSFITAFLWLLLVEALSDRKVLSSDLSRKLTHIGTGPIFVLTWNLFSNHQSAPFLASLVPLALTLRFAVIGLGLVDDPAVVQSLSRTGDRREILRGPLYYGLVFIVATAVFWRHSPIGILSLMLMCGGDGLADVIGRRWGKQKIPFSPGKSWVGSAAMFVGSFVFGYAYLLLFNLFGNFTPALNISSTAFSVALISVAATFVEMLPIKDIDNLTTTMTAILLGLLLF